MTMCYDPFQPGGTGGGVRGDRENMKLFNWIVNPKEVRTKLGLNQQEFWTKIGVTQSGGSRYESGREMPKPVRELLRLVHVEKIDLTKVKKEDFEVIEYLKSANPDLYRELRKRSKGKRSSKSGGPDSEH
jgi:bifunctional DNA-binding transcriptional regulator/antitoxin component of YhaV-PrlF toxin-antitoxin module